MNQALDNQDVDTAFTGFLDKLGTYTPKTLSDVEALVNGYAGAFDAYSLYVLSDNKIKTIKADMENGKYGNGAPDLLYNLVDDLSDSLQIQLQAKGMIEQSDAMFEVGRDMGGAPFDAKKVNLQQVGDFFRKGAEANYNAFVSEGVVADVAKETGKSPDVILDLLASNDDDVACAITQKNITSAMESYIGKGKPNAAFALMGYGVQNYARNQMLIEKYYNNTEIDPKTLKVTGLRFEGAVDNAINLSKDQFVSEIMALRSHNVEPMLSVGAFEATPSTVDSSPEGKYAELSTYSRGFVMTKLLNYLGGWQDKTVGATNK
jgi:hypothetical protein